MKALHSNIDQLAFGKADDEPLSSDEQNICDEWTSGKAAELMMIDSNDPRLLEYLGLYDKLESKKEAVWESIDAVHSLSIAVQEKKIENNSRWKKYLQAIKSFFLTNKLKIFATLFIIHLITIKSVQAQTVELDLTNVKVTQALEVIKKQTGLSYTALPGLLKKAKKVSIKFKGPFLEALNKICEDSYLHLALKGNHSSYSN
jgi:hypothetical protein